MLHYSSVPVIVLVLCIVTCIVLCIVACIVAWLSHLLNMLTSKVFVSFTSKTKRRNILLTQKYDIRVTRASSVSVAALYTAATVDNARYTERLYFSVIYLLI